MARRGLSVLCFIVLVALATEGAASAAVVSTTRLSVQADAIEGLSSARLVRDWEGEISLLPIGPREFSITAQHLQGTLYQTTERYIVTPNGVRVADGERSTEPVPLDLRRATFAPVSTDASFVVSFPPSETHSQMELLGGLSDLVLEPATFRLFPTIDPSPGGTALEHRSYETDGPRLKAQGLGMSLYDGPIEIFSWSTRLSGDESDGHAASFESGETSEADPVVAAAPPRAVVTLHHFAGNVTNLAIDGVGNGLAYWAREFTPWGAVDVVAKNADGWIEGPAGHIDVDAADVRVAGEPVGVTLAAPQPDDEMRISMAGDDRFSHIFVDGRRVESAPDPGLPTGTVAATTVGALLAGLGAILFHFKLAPLITGFGRRRKDEPAPPRVNPTLRNETRRRIMEVIQERPGVQQFHVWKRIGGAFGVTLRGLDLLERAGLVRSFKHGKSRHYYENDPKFTAGAVQVFAAMATRTLGETLNVIHERAPISQKELAQALGITVSTLSGRLARLERDGMIVRERRGGLNLYSMTPAASSFHAGSATNPPASGFHFPTTASPALTSPTPPVADLSSAPALRARSAGDGAPTSF